MISDPDLCNRIISACSIIYGVSEKNLKSGGYADCVTARRAAMTLIKDFLPGTKDSVVGMMFDGYKPATVVSGVARYRRLVNGCRRTYERERAIRNLIMHRDGNQPRTADDVAHAMGL